MPLPSFSLVVTAFVLLAATAPSQTKTDVRLVSDVALSPDGQRIAFAWRGDLWTAPVTGGAIQRLTTHAANDRQPAFSPDGQHIAFVSNRTGSDQVHITDLMGSAARCVTRHTAGYRLLEWAPDGEHLLVSLRRDHFWSEAQRLALIPIEGREPPKVLFDDYADSGSLSPDGKQVLFTRESAPTYRKNYRGSQESQVWLFDRSDQSFRRLHAGEGGSRWPLFAEDKNTYLYVSQRNGTWNLHRCRLDTDGDETLTSFEDDGVFFPCVARNGSVVVFSRLFDLMRWDKETGEVQEIPLHYVGDPTVEAEERLTVTSASSVAFTDDGREIAFAAEGDIWVMDTELREPVRVTDTPEEERNPIFTADHEGLIFESDAEGQTDLWLARRGDTKAWWWQNKTFALERLTNDEAAESSPRLVPHTNNLAYLCARGDVLLMDLTTRATRSLIASWNAPSFDFSPDGKWVVYSVQDDDFNADVWIKPLDGHRKPFNVSCHPDNDRGPVWSSDGKFIAFTGRRFGTETDVVWVSLSKETDDESDRDRRLKKALEKMKGRTEKKAKEDPKADATKQDDSKKKPEATPAWDGASGAWRGVATGPDPIPSGGLPFTLTLTLAGNKLSGRYESMLGESKLEGTFDVTTGKITLAGQTQMGELELTGTLTKSGATGTWSSGGFKGEWTAKAPTEAVAAVEANSSTKSDKGSEAAKKDDKGIPKVVIDFEGLLDRLKRVPIPGSDEGGLLFAAKEPKLYFRATVSGKSGVYEITLPAELTPKYVAESFGSRPVWLADGKTLAATGSGTPSTTDVSGKRTSYAFSTPVERDTAAWHHAIFDQAWRTMRDRYYDGNFGGRDWDAVRAKYGAMAARCLTPEDLSRVVNMMLGELNGSHLGFRFGGASRRQAQSSAGDGWNDVTGHLGARFDADHQGEGLLIRDVIDGTPAAREQSRLFAGDVILTIDGQRTDPKVDIAYYLTLPPNKDVTLGVRDKDGKERTVILRPTTDAAVRGQLYETWMNDNRAKVAELSGGRLGYLHIRGMGEPNLLRFDAELYRVGHGKDGIVIDVRENGGGSITDHLLTSLCQPTHAITRPRGGGEGYPHDRRVYATWDKPIVVLCNQNSFSNAEIFSHSIKTLGRGKVVGVPTAGGVISTGGAALLGGAFIRLPFRGWYLLDGEDMELNGCVPDFVLWPEPGELPRGIDRQLEKAVAVLSADVVAYKSQPRPRLKKASERK